MISGHLSQYFTGLAAKVLSAVEVDPDRSNQHEFNGVGGLKNILGEPEGTVRYKTTFMYLDDENDPLTAEGNTSWYDARQRGREERGVMRYEYRLYFPSNTVTEMVSEGDILVIAKLADNTLLAIVANPETTIAHQILWLLGFNELPHSGFSVREDLDEDSDTIKYTSSIILENIGIAIDHSDDSFLDNILSEFGTSFPTTRVFSAYAQSTLPEIHPEDGCDSALVAWLEREELLFRTLEKHIVGGKLREGFNEGVDEFISYSLSVQNRRKARAGLALENHLETIFDRLGVKHSRTPVTENKSKPDFIFPGKEEYHTDIFDASLLTMLGVKSTCKDRWRQVLSEADRVQNKHLLTMETAISNNQTDEMKSSSLQLVLPKALHSSYQPEQQSWLMNLKEFIDMVLDKQSS